jgi:hypothetical protein
MHMTTQEAETMITKLNVAAAVALVIGFAGVAHAGEGSVDSDNFGGSRYNAWNQTYSPTHPWGGMAPGYSYAPGDGYNVEADIMTGYTVRPSLDSDDDDDDDADE